MKERLRVRVSDRVRERKRERERERDKGLEELFDAKEKDNAINKEQEKSDIINRKRE